jgi:hypothetical protein
MEFMLIAANVLRKTFTYFSTVSVHYAQHITGGFSQDEGTTLQHLSIRSGAGAELHDHQLSAGGV